MDNKIIYQNHINMISIQLLYCMGGYVTYEVTISTGRFCGSCNFCISEDTVKDYAEVIAVSYTHLTLPTNSRV